MDSNKNTIICVLVAFIIVLSAILFLNHKRITQGPRSLLPVSQTNNNPVMHEDVWKIYSDPNYHFHFMYPGTGMLQPTTGTVDGVVEYTKIQNLGVYDASNPYREFAKGQFFIEMYVDQFKQHDCANEDEWSLPPARVTIGDVIGYKGIGVSHGFIAAKNEALLTLCVNRANQNFTTRIIYRTGDDQMANTVIDSFAWDNQNESVSEWHSDTVTDSWFYISELRIKFRNINGLTPKYTQVDEGEVEFSTSEEIVAYIKNHPALFGCDANVFADVALSIRPRFETEYQGYSQVVLGNGVYLNRFGPQSECWQGNPNQEERTFIVNQQKLFSQFFDTVEMY